MTMNESTGKRKHQYSRVKMIGGVTCKYCTGCEEYYPLNRYNFYHDGKRWKARCLDCLDRMSQDAYANKDICGRDGCQDRRARSKSGRIYVYCRKHYNEYARQYGKRSRENANMGANNHDSK